MRLLKKSLLFASLGCAALFAAVGVARAVETSHQLHAESHPGMINDYGNGQFDVTATITGGGVVQAHGTVELYGQYESFGSYMDLSTGVVPLYEFYGLIHNAHGRLYLRFSNPVLARADGDAWEFSADGVIYLGEGTYSGATGTLHFHGWTTEVAGYLVGFTFDDISGTITLDRP
jgi:hypothetical protein